MLVMLYLIHTTNQIKLMKRNLLTAVFCLLSCGAFAQISVGVKAGLNMAKLGGDADTDFRAAYLAGAYLGVNLADKFKLQPEVLYVSSGAKYSGVQSGISYDETTNLSYIYIPVMFMYKIAGPLNVQAGPQIGILTKAETTTEIKNIPDRTDDIKDGLKGSDFGFNVGLGLDLGKFNVSARYCIGLSDINDTGGGDAKNQGIQVAMGYSIFSIGD